MVLPSSEILAQTEMQPERMLLCRACGHAITFEKSAIAVQGDHEHTFRNPAGYSFHVRCFEEAPGVQISGAPTPEASWFAGTVWRFASCQRCQEHLGWRYEGSRNFYGLIATRLTSAG